MKKKLKNLKMTSSILIGSSSAISITGTVVSTTGVGLIFGGPLIGVGTLIGLFSLIPLKMEKSIFKEIVKNEKLLSLIYSKVSSIRRVINKSLKDNKIKEEEYKYIEYEFGEYKLMEEEEIKVKTTLKEKKESPKMISLQIQKELVEVLKSLKK